jgi:hypothetical protein
MRWVVVFDVDCRETDALVTEMSSVLTPLSASVLCYFSELPVLFECNLELRQCPDNPKYTCILLFTDVSFEQ